jgi:hypothetical protein
VVTSHNIHHSRRLVKAPVFPPAGPESWSLMTTIRENPFVTSRVARGPPSPSPRVDDPTPWMTLVTALRWQPRTRCAAAVPRRCPRRAAPPPLLRELRPTADLKSPAGRLINIRVPSTRRSASRNDALYFLSRDRFRRWQAIHECTVSTTNDAAAVR